MILRVWLTSFLVLGLVGCDSGMPQGDAGPGQTRDGGAPYACAQPMMMTLTQDPGADSYSGELTFDTSMSQVMPQDLGLNCGNAEAELRWAPQEVVQIEVPGTGTRAIEFSTVNEETTANMVVFLQARKDGCDTVPAAARFPPTCFGPVAPTPPALPDNAEWRSRGQIMANGGDTVFLFVTGFSEPPADERNLTDRGTVRLEVSVTPNEVPEIEDAVFLLEGNDVRVEMNGSDPNANVRGVLMNFYNADGLLDIYGDGTASESTSLFVQLFDDPVSTGFDWRGGTWIRSTPDDGATQLGEYLVAQQATRVQLRVFDGPNGISEPVMRDIGQAELVGFGENCDAARICRAEMRCVDGTCAIPDSIMSSCNAATDAALPGIVDQAVTVTLSGATGGAGAGSFAPEDGCTAPEGARGPESIYLFNVADITFDLLLSTDLAGTGTTDTIVYVRRGCFDRGSEIGCADNIAMDNPQTELEIRDLAPGNYYVFVEEFQSDMVGDGTHQLRITARPVLQTGASCDVAEVMNRCAAGACSAGVCP